MSADCIQASKSKGLAASTDISSWALIDQLLLVKSEDDAPISEELQKSLQQAVDQHFKTSKVVAGR
jgi:hypothetical protein